MKKVPIVFAPAAIVLILLVNAAAADTEVIAIPDQELERAIRLLLGKLSGNLTSTDMESLTELNASDVNRTQPANAVTPIQSLEGLQAAANLESLNLAGGNSDQPNLSPNIDLSAVGSLTLAAEGWVQLKGGIEADSGETSWTDSGVPISSRPEGYYRIRGY